MPPPAKIAVADELGVCEIPIPRGFRFFSGTDGFVDELVSWSPDEGNTVPSRYTLRLKRAASIGGLAVDEEGKPLAGVGIEFENLTRFEPRDESNPESPRIAYFVGYPTADDSPTAVTDKTGHWQIERFAREDIGHMMIHAACPGYIVNPPAGGSFPLQRGAGPEAEKQLLAGTYSFTLIRSLPLSGVIVDMNGDPVREASVRVGNASALGRANPRLPTTTTNQADGTFGIAGCIPGKNQVTVEAPGFARATQEVDLTSETAPLRLVLQPGKILRLRVLDTNGLPPARASVQVMSALGTFLTVLGSEADGRAVWRSSPEGELQIAVFIQGTLREATNLLVQANGEEQLVTLSPTAPTSSNSRGGQELAVSGTVTDAATRLPIPRFRVIRGSRAIF